MKNSICQPSRWLASARIITAATAILVATVAMPAYAQIVIEETTTTPANHAHRPATKPKTGTHHAKPGTAKGTHAYSTPKLLWRTLLQHIDGTPAVDGDTVFAAAGADVYALDSGGHTLAMTEIGQTQASPLLDPNRVYIGNDHGAVFGLDRHTTKPLWKFSVSDEAILTTPAVGAGRLYVECTDNNIYGLAASTGGQIWKFQRPDGSLGYAGPVYVPAESVAISTSSQQSTFTGGADGLIVCGDASVYRIDPASGRQTWHTLLAGGKSLSTPAVGAGRIYVGADGAGLTALALSDGRQAWNFSGKSERDWFGEPLLADGVVYVVTHNRYVYAVDAATGAARWSSRLLTPGLGAPAIDTKRHVLYVATTTGGDNPTITALDSRTGVHLWDAKIGSITGAPTISGDHLYIGSASGYFYCYDLR